MQKGAPARQIRTKSRLPSRCGNRYRYRLTCQCGAQCVCLVVHCCSTLDEDDRPGMSSRCEGNCRLHCDRACDVSDMDRRCLSDDTACQGGVDGGRQASGGRAAGVVACPCVMRTGHCLRGYRVDGSPKGRCRRSGRFDAERNDFPYRRQQQRHNPTGSQDGRFHFFLLPFGARHGRKSTVKCQHPRYGGWPRQRSILTTLHYHQKLSREY